MKQKAQTLVMIPLCLVFAILAGCTSVGRDFDETQVTNIVKGETTEAELINMLGEPTSRFRSDDGRQTLSWANFESRMKAQTFIPIVGAFLGGSNQQMKTLNVIMAADGTVESYTTGSSAYEMETL